MPPDDFAKQNQRAALGICDLCGGPVPSGQWYTTKGRPRLHCSVDCRQTANSRTGAPIRRREMQAHVAAGEWINPASIHAPDPANVAAGVSRARKAEVVAGTWRNPALTDAARRKLSRPRKYHGALARAMDKLRRGTMTDLTEAEHAAYLRYRRRLRQARLDADRAYHREWSRHKWESLTPAERETQRERWREKNKSRRK
jgi:hypothetical protein